jgi:hypothetical protein
MTVGDIPALPGPASPLAKPDKGKATTQYPGSGRHISFAKEPGLEVVMESSQESDAAVSMDSDSDS